MARSQGPSHLPLQRPGPFARFVPKRIRTLPYESVHPVVRIAHRMNGMLTIPERIIFDHELVYLAEGTCEVAFETGRHTLEPGDLLLIEPFEPHSFRSPGGVVCTHIAVHFDLAPDQPARAKPYAVRLTGGLALPRLGRYPGGSVVPRCMDQAVEAMARPDPPARLAAASAVLRVLLEMLTPRPDGSTDHRNRRRVAQVASFIHDHFARPLASEDLAAVVDLSVPHLTRLFRETMGYSPMEYVRRVRVDRAKVLLADVNLSVKQIARRVGFDDPLHFSRVFRKTDGLPPTTYREAILAGRVGGSGALS